MNKRIPLSLPDGLFAEIRAASAARGEAISVWIREAIREKLDRHALEQAALDSPAIRAAVSEALSGDRSVLRRRSSHN